MKTYPSRHKGAFTRRRHLAFLVYHWFNRTTYWDKTISYPDCGNYSYYNHFIYCNHSNSTTFTNHKFKNRSTSVSKYFVLHSSNYITYRNNQFDVSMEYKP